MTRRRRAGGAMISPLVIGLLVISIYPFLYLLALAFTKSTLGQPFQKWDGFGNFDWAFTGTDFSVALWRTILFAAIVSAIQLVLGLGIAQLLFRLQAGRWTRTIVLLPLMTAPIMVAIAWKLILNPTGGLVSSVLMQLGLTSEPVSFLGSTSLAFPAIMLADTWQWTPFIVILCYAGLQSLPHDVYEAAQLDGAYPRTIFLKVTLPMLAPLLVAVFLLKMVIAFKTFDLVYVMTFGGPGAATNVATFEIWKTGLHEFDIGLAAAETLVLAVAVSVVTLPVVFLHNYADRKL